jgi:murein DD-endopeptidase MepM/ murein hydrolase activator NlpD
LATDSKITSDTTGSGPGNGTAKPGGRGLPSDLWLRLASHGLAIGLVVAAIWIARLDFNHVPAVSLPVGLAVTGTPAAQVARATPTAQPLELPTDADQTGGAAALTRLADVHTIIPSRPRYEIQQYTVQLHDTLFIIAAKYNIKPDTVLWGNPVLAGDPNTLSVGQVLNILPVDGALRIVQGGDTLQKIASAFHGTVEDIVNFPGNDIDPTDPEIKNGENIIIPGGWRDVTIWQLPVVSRTTTGGSVSGSSGEPGACKGPFSGPSGTFTFAWPANNHYLSGNDFSPTIHPGIDIAAGLGAPIYASDTGVVVFAGLSLYGYGNLVIIDHGNGWQTAYGHLSQINVVCGGAIYQGQVLGLAGSTGNSTGPHLHFEMRSDQYGRVNPWLYLGK